jgi:DNA-directed RNA polymerase subunit RPC12/RpoP
MKLKDWLRDPRGKQPPDEVYVDAAAVPAEPEGPYRARMAAATHTAASGGIDVSEREVVTGQLQLIYRIRCTCGHQWDALQFQRMSICPQCGRAVLVEAPKPSAG